MHTLSGSFASCLQWNAALLNDLYVGYREAESLSFNRLQARISLPPERDACMHHRYNSRAWADSFYSSMKFELWTAVTDH